MVSQGTVPEPACSRIDHESGYIELCFMETSRKAVDELINHLVDIVANPPDTPLMRILVSSRKLEKAQPIMYLMKRLRAEQPKLRPQNTVRLAVTFTFAPLSQMINLFVRALTTTHIRFKAFSVEDEQEAISWLLHI